MTDQAVDPSPSPPPAHPPRRPARVPAWLRRVPPVVKIIVGVAVLVLVGVVVKDVVTPGPPARCVFACAEVPSIAPSTGYSTFTSQSYGFTFSYQSGAQSAPAGTPVVANLVYTDTNNNFFGEAIVAAGQGTPQLSSLVSGEASALTHSISDLQPTGPMLGAEIGLQSGDGEFYSGNFPQPSGTTLPVSIGIVAVQHGTVWVYMVGVSIVDPSSSNPDAFQLFDGIVDFWQWKV